MKKLLCTGLLMSCLSVYAQNLNLRINEILTNNETTVMDDFFEYDDWVEIYNPPGSPITNLAGYYISDDPDTLTKWQIPAIDAGVTSVLPNSFVALWIDDDFNNNNSQGAAHNAGFVLSSEGETFLLTAPDGVTIIDSISYPEMAPDVSWGRSCDGCPNWQYFNNVTFEDNNFEQQNNDLLFINEVQTINAATYDDLEGEFDPWFEIFNPNNHQVNIANYSININGVDWTVPGTRPVRTVIPPGGYLLIWCDDDVADDVNHSPLELPLDGATIELTGPDGLTNIDSYGYPSIPPDHSWGRANDGSANSILFTSPTPTVTNQLIVIQPENIVINELLTANQNGIPDNVGELEDWFEIYNPNSFPVDLSGYYFSDDPEVRNKWVVPSTFPDSVTVPPFGWLLFWADADAEQGVLHADFRLSNNGEYLCIAGPDGYTLADEIQWNYIAPDTSLGRITDGNSEWTLFVTSTPDASNNQGTVEVEAYVAGGILAYPNPANRTVFFNQNISGRIMTSTGTLVNSLSNVISLDVNEYRPGVYLLQTNNGETLRIIVQ